MQSLMAWSPSGELLLQRFGIQLTNRVKKRNLRTYPQPKRGRRGAKELARRIQEWDSAVGTLNPEVAMKVTSKVVQAIMARW